LVEKKVPGKINNLKKWRSKTMAIVHLNDQNFDKEVMKSDLPVLVDFFAEWCGPCKKLSVVFDEVSKAYDGKVKFAKINIEEGQDTANKFGVMSVPTLIFFREGNISAQKSGFLTKEQLVKEINNNL